MNYLASLRVKEEIVALDNYMTNVQGEQKMHFERLLGQYGQVQEALEEQRRLKREYDLEVASLKYSLEEEKEEEGSLEEKLESTEESYNETIDKFIKERDHARAKVKVLKKEKVKFGVGHAKLVKDLEDLDRAHKVLESEHSILSKSHDQLHI
jgi:chromosome segregation ATPase